MSARFIQERNADHWDAVEDREIRDRVTSVVETAVKSLDPRIADVLYEGPEEDAEYYCKIWSEKPGEFRFEALADTFDGMLREAIRMIDEADEINRMRVELRSARAGGKLDVDMDVTVKADSEGGE